MELKHKIETAITSLKLDSPIIDISADENGNFYGYICSKTFEGQQDERIQEQIWGALKIGLREQELVKIMLLMAETPMQRLMRLEGNHKSPNKYDTCLWVHSCPDLANYWLFIGTSKVDDAYSVSYFWLDDSNNDIENGLILTYPKEVLDFMNLEQSEIIPEIYDNAICNATAEIKTKIMEKYNSDSKQGRWGGSSIYHYVFTSFEILPVDLRTLLLNKETAERIKRKLAKLPDSLQKQKVLKQITMMNSVNATAKNV